MVEVMALFFKYTVIGLIVYMFSDQIRDILKGISKRINVKTEKLEKEVVAPLVTTSEGKLYGKGDNDASTH